MSDFLASLIVRSVEPASDIRPRLASRFEPIGRVTAPPPGEFDAHDLEWAGWDIDVDETVPPARVARRRPAPPADTFLHQLESEPDGEIRDQDSPPVLSQPRTRRTATPETPEPRTAAMALDREPVAGERVVAQPAPDVEEIVRPVERARPTAPPSAASPGSSAAPVILESPAVELEAASPSRPKRKAPPADISPVHRAERKDQRSAAESQTQPRAGMTEDPPALIPAQQPATARLKPSFPAAPIMPSSAWPANPARDAAPELVPVRARRSAPVDAPALPIPQPAPLFRQSPQSAPPETQINVTIGRVEVRATASSATAPRSSRGHAAAPSLSLDDYLLQRARGGRP
jgi:hypothetical protein